MYRWFRCLPLLLTALWLPLQAVAAVAMPFCRHAAEHAAQVWHSDAPGQDTHCHEHEGSGDDVPQAATAGDQDCDGCELCHLASAGYLPAAVAGPDAQLPAGDFSPLPLRASPSHITEPPHHPPRRLS